MKARLNNRTLLLSAAVLLVVAVTVIVIRRRGRKVYIAEPYRLNNQYDILLNLKDGSDVFSGSNFYRGTLDYVVVPYGYKDDVWQQNGIYYYPVIAIGFATPDGKVRRVKLENRAYIDSRYIGISY